MMDGCIIQRRHFSYLLLYSSSYSHIHRAAVLSIILPLIRPHRPSGVGHRHPSLPLGHDDIPSASYCCRKISPSSIHSNTIPQSSPKCNAIQRSGEPLNFVGGFNSKAIQQSTTVSPHLFYKLRPQFTQAPIAYRILLVKSPKVKFQAALKKRQKKSEAKRRKN